MKVLHSNH